MATLATTLLQIRLLQIRREIQTLGWWHKLLFSGMLAALIGGLYQAFLRVPGCWYALGALWTAALAAQMFRPDKNFVYLHVTQPKQAIFLEYTGLSLPFILPALFTENWYCFLFFPVGLILITWVTINFNPKSRFIFIGKFFPKAAFECIAGFRQSLVILVPVYLLALALCWLKILPVALLWLFCGIVLGFYQVSEPLQMLRAVANTPKELLRKKILEMGKMLSLVCLPVIVLQTIFHPWLGLAGLAFLILQFCVLAFAIFLKYSNYEPNQTQHSNMLLLAFAQLSVVLPFFLILPLALIFRQYNRAKLNLQLYLPPC